MVLNLVVSRIQRPVQVSYLIVPENLNTQITNGDQQNTQKVVATIRVSREKNLGVDCRLSPAIGERPLQEYPQLINRQQKFLNRPGLPGRFFFF
jgi:hypothetical protein